MPRLNIDILNNARDSWIQFAQDIGFFKATITKWGSIDSCQVLLGSCAGLCLLHCVGGEERVNTILGIYTVSHDNLITDF